MMIVEMVVVNMMMLVITMVMVVVERVSVVRSYQKEPASGATLFPLTC